MRRSSLTRSHNGDGLAGLAPVRHYLDADRRRRSARRGSPGGRSGWAATRKSCPSYLHDPGVDDAVDLTAMLGETRRRAAQEEHPGFGGRGVDERDLLYERGACPLTSDSGRRLNATQSAASDHPAGRQFADTESPVRALDLIDRENGVEQRVQREVQRSLGDMAGHLGQTPWVGGGRSGDA